MPPTQGRVFAICTSCIGLLLACLVMPAAGATFGHHDYSVELGASFADTSYLIRGGIGLPFAEPLLAGDRWQVDAVIEGFAGHWDAKSTARAPDELFELGITGMAQLWWHSAPGFFIEFSTGVSYLSAKAINGREFGSNFQFASHFGLGWRVDGAWSLIYRLEHLSNAGLATPNPGVDYHLLNVRYQPSD